MTRETRKQIRALVDLVVADREDAAIVRPIVAVMVATAVHDFERYYEVQHAATRVRDYELLSTRNQAKI